MIRRANENDLESIVALGKAFHAESPRYRSVPFIEEHAMIFVAETMVNTLTKCAFVYEVDGKVVGMIGGSVEVFALFNHDVLMSVDTSFFVDPAYRGSRCAVALLKAYESWALATGAHRDHVYLSETAGINSAEVHEFLEKMGYTATGKIFRRKF